MVGVRGQEQQPPARRQHAVSFRQHPRGFGQVFEHPQRNGHVEAARRKRQPVAQPAYARKAGPVLAERVQVRVQPHRSAHLAPEQLHHPAAPAAQVQHPAVGRQMPAGQGLEGVPARPPARMPALVASAVAVLFV